MLNVRPIALRLASLCIYYTETLAVHNEHETKCDIQSINTIIQNVFKNIKRTSTLYGTVIRVAIFL